MSRYRDDDAASTSSRSSRSSRSGNTANNPSYVDRFRPNAAFQQPQAPASGRQGPASIPQLLSLIQSAVRPTLRKPDLATNLQIADLINEKKGSAPREAANAIVSHINQRPETAVLAMSVLDVCVKNCGYPFHLQISRKDFLNKLVKRFPEKPPIRYSQTQTLILEAIQEWRETICRTSKHKQDFGFIRDMHRLLQYKGYIFPQINREDAAVLNAPDALKTPQELEEEDREAQSAKLHELLHSGQPKDLEEANKIMKVLAGFKDQSTDYKAATAKKLDETRQKCEILEEMVNSASPGDKPDKNDVFYDLCISLQSALPQIAKIQQAEQEEDPEAAEKCLQLYSYIQTVVRKYELLAQGDFDGAQNLPIQSLASGNLRNAPKASLIDSLIDIGDEPSPAPTGTETSSGDLLGLDFGGLTLGGTPTAGTPAAAATGGSSDFDIFGGTTAASSSATPITSPGASSLDIFGTSNSASNPAASEGPTTSAFSDETVVLKFSANRTDTSNITAVITNPSSKKITNLKLEIAAPKSRPVTMGVVSSTQLDSGPGSITQSCTFPGTEPVKFRWRLSFKSGLSEITQSGTESGL